MADAASVLPNDLIYQYVKLVVENPWAFIFLGVAVWLSLNKDLLNRLAKIKFGEFEFEWLKAQVEEAKDQVAVVQAQNRQLREVLETDFDADAPLDELAVRRQSLKSVAARLEDSDLSIIHEGLQASANAQQLYTAAVLARTRRDPRFFGEIVKCLDRLSRDGSLGGMRLNTVWTLVSALHLTLVSDFADDHTPELNRAQVLAAEPVLHRLSEHRRVLDDRPDDPMRGILGPTTYALNWIGKALKKLPEH